MEKQKALNELYALRAGLSAISQEYDKAQKIEADCNEKLAENAKNFCGDLVCYSYKPTQYSNIICYPKLETLQRRYGYIEDYEDKIQNGEIQADETVKATKNWYSHINENNLNGRKAFNCWLADDECDLYFNRILNDRQSEKESTAKGWYDDHRAEYKKNAKKDKILAILFFIIAAVLIVPPVLISQLFSMSTGVLIFYLLFPVVFFILGIVFICASVSNKKAHNKQVTDKDEYVKTAQWLVDNLPQSKQNARALLKQKDEKIAPIIKVSDEFYTALAKRFNPLLDERDWKNLDLVIYELETRRADSVKEALQLVDRELQTARIEQKITQATEQICQEIRSGFASLKETIIECSRVISSQLSAISLQLGEMSGQLSDLCDSVNMSNALQAKANVTSAQLLSDVHAIRYYQ